MSRTARRTTARRRPAGLALALALAAAAAGGLAPFGVRARAAERLQFEIVRFDAPVAIEPGGTLTIPIEVRNTGSETWKARGRVRLSYHWLEPGGAVLVRDGARTSMPRDVPAGDTVTLCARVDAPPRPGSLVLEWDLVEEGVAWVSSLQPGRRFLHPVAIGAVGGAVLVGWQPAARAALLLAATLGHFLLVALWVRRFGGAGIDAEELAFAAVVIGLGSLQSVLHALAVTVGLSLGGGLIALGLLHLAAGLASLRRARRAGETAGGGGAAPPPVGLPGDPVTRLLAIAGVVVVAALAVDWVLAASHSFRVAGADAAHYHVPHAVDFALGASPFGLVATPHQYPMATSILVAWFILPFGDPLLVDLATLLPFLLAWVAALRLVRFTTGVSGLAWGPWVALVFFSLPLVRESLQVSADLFYAAAFLALNAQLLEALVTRRVSGVNLLCLAFAAGMLVGTKTTGAFSTLALVGLYGAAMVGVAGPSGRRLSLAGVRMGGVALAAAGVVMSGGIWLIRNWWEYGSPFAPTGLSIFGVQVFAGPPFADSMYYLSVLDDMRSRPGYDVVARTLHWIAVWFGAWFLPLGALVVVPVADAWRQRRASGAFSDVARARLVFIGVSVALIAAHFVLIATAPWSSLERSKGFALRYLLPCFGLYLFAAASAGWPESLAWFRRPGASRVAAVLLPTASIGWYVWRQGPAGVPLDDAIGRLTPFAVIVALAVVGAALALGRWTRGLARLGGAAAMIGILAAAAGVHAAATDGRLTGAAASSLQTDLRCSLIGAGTVDDYRGVFLQALANERAAGNACTARRFFLATRFDSPLALQPAAFTSLVYDSRGLDNHPDLLERFAPGRDRCDYLVARRSELASDHGVPLVKLLMTEKGFRQVGASGNFALFAR